MKKIMLTTAMVSVLTTAAIAQTNVTGQLESVILILVVIKD